MLRSNACGCALSDRLSEKCRYCCKSRNQTSPKISQKPMLRRLGGCNARQGRYEGLWSFWVKRCESLTSSGGERASCSEKISFVSQEGLFQHYPPIADINTKEPPPIREAAFASLKARLRPVPAPVGLLDANEDREASGRRRTLQCDSRKTIARPARSS